MTNPTQQLAGQLIHDKDKIIAACIGQHLGYDDWTLEDVLHRGEWIYLPCKTEQFVMDKVILVEFYPPTFTPVDNDGFSYKMGGNINYRVFV